jgi:hypothetical protein
MGPVTTPLESVIVLMVMAQAMVMEMLEPKVTVDIFTPPPPRMILMARSSPPDVHTNSTELMEQQNFVAAMVIVTSLLTHVSAMLDSVTPVSLSCLHISRLTLVAP